MGFSVGRMDGCLVGSTVKGCCRQDGALAQVKARKPQASAGNRLSTHTRREVGWRNCWQDRGRARGQSRGDLHGRKSDVQVDRRHERLIQK